MSKSAERPSGTVATLLNVIAFGGFVDLWKKTLIIRKIWKC